MTTSTATTLSEPTPDPLPLLASAAMFSAMADDATALSLTLTTTGWVEPPAVTTTAYVTVSDNGGSNVYAPGLPCTACGTHNCDLNNDRPGPCRHPRAHAENSMQMWAINAGRPVGKLVTVTVPAGNADQVCAAARAAAEPTPQNVIFGGTSAKRETVHAPGNGSVTLCRPSQRSADHGMYETTQPVTCRVCLRKLP